MNGSKRPHVAVGEARGLVDAVRALRAGNLGPVEILDECLERIEASEREVGAWVEIDADGARRTAARQAGLPRDDARGLPLLGIPIGVKDIIDVAGLPTKAGSVLRSGHRAQRDAPIVKVLRDLGAILLGKTETTQFAVRDHARTRNPWNLDRSPGGSSAGSAAAVASGMCPAALGTQTGGSITRPASFCGVASFKGAWGTWPLDDIVPVSQHLDHVGPMARSVADLALLWTLVEARLRPERAAYLSHRSEAILTGEWLDRAPPRLAVIEEYFYEASEPSALDAFTSCIARLEEAGATVERLALPPSFAGMHASHGLVMAVEAADVHRRDFAERPDTYRPGITQLIENGLAALAVDYRAARVHQQRFAADLAATLDAPAGPVVALSPATVSGAPPFDDHYTGDAQFNSVWSFSGLPTCGVPACLGKDGLPLSLQLGAARESFALFQAAAWCEAVLEFPDSARGAATLVRRAPQSVSTDR